MTSSGCHEMPHNHCTFESGAPTGKWIGMERVDGEEVCVTECPAGSYANP